MAITGETPKVAAIGSGWTKLTLPCLLPHKCLAPSCSCSHWLVCLLINALHVVWLRSAFWTEAWCAFDVAPDHFLGTVDGWWPMRFQCCQASTKFSVEKAMTAMGYEAEPWSSPHWLERTCPFDYEVAIFATIHAAFSSHRETMEAFPNFLRLATPTTFASPTALAMSRWTAASRM